MDTNVQVIARNPAQMIKSQAAVIEWCDRKIEATIIEVADLTENYEIARQNKWRSRPWKQRMKLQERKRSFYEKVKAALEAGYYMIPPFPVDIFAIRTDRKKPNTTDSGWYGTQFLQKPRLLPEGQGEYVSDRPLIFQRTETVKNNDGTTKEVTHYWPKEFQDVDFPFGFAKPAVLKAASEAMARKLFDQMGVLPIRRRDGDPMIVGQIVHPNKRFEYVTFFVAWWMNYEDL